MRDYGKLEPTFWTRGSGKRLRGHPEAQLVALYAFSAPGGNVIGIYYVSLPTIAHETGLPMEGVRKGLRRASEEGILVYDDENEVMWVPGLCARSVGPRLEPKDNRRVMIEKALDQVGEHPFAKLFLKQYRSRYGLRERPEIAALDVTPFQGPSVTPPGPPSDPLRSQEQEQEEEQEMEKEPLRGAASAPGSSPEIVAMRDEIRKHRVFDALDAQAIAQAHEGYRFSKAQRLEYVLNAIDECATKSAGLPLRSEALQAKLAGFMRHASKPREIPPEHDAHLRARPESTTVRKSRTPEENARRRAEIEARTAELVAQGGAKA